MENGSACLLSCDDYDYDCPQDKWSKFRESETVEFIFIDYVWV